MTENIYKGSYNNMADYSAQARWQAANFRRYTVNFKNEDDAELIAYIESNKSQQSTTDIFREALQMLIDSKK